MLEVMPEADDALVLAYFFLPLPDPLGLPDGFIVEFVRPESMAEWVARHDVDDQHGPPAELLTASLRFWRAKVPAETATLDLLASVAEKALPDLRLPKRSIADDSAQVDRTVVEMVVPVSDSEDGVSDAFDEGLQMLRDFQRAYYIARRIPLRLVTREQLPVFVPFGVRRVSAEGDEWPDGLSVMLLHQNLHAEVRDEEIDVGEGQRLHRAIEMQSVRRVFTPFLDLRREADVALRRDGDTRACVIFAGSAAELLLDDLLAHLLWEEGLRPEQAVSVFEGVGVIARVRTEYHGRLRGAGWSLHDTGPVRAWNDRLAAARHRAVHAGYEPTLDEAYAAFDALNGLERFVGDRLADQRVLRTYPRTAMAYLGDEGLRRRGAWSARMRRLAHDPSEPGWVGTFLRWRAAMDRCRAEPPPGVPAPDTARSFVLAVVHPGRQVVWVLHDRQAGAARRCEEPEPATPEAAGALAALLEELQREGLDEAVSVFVEDTRNRALQDAPWLPEYRLVPMAGVMVDGSDLDPP